MLIVVLLLFLQFLGVLLSAGLVVFAFSCLPLPVPYLPSRQLAISRALEALELTPNDVFYDIGSGDGRMVLAAHTLEPQALCIGIEKRRALHLVGQFLRWRIGSPAHVMFRREDFYATRYTDATKIYVFLWPSVMSEMEPLFERHLSNVTLVSCDFPLPHKKAVRSIELEPQSRNGIFRRLYVYRYE